MESTRHKHKINAGVIQMQIIKATQYQCNLVSGDLIVIKKGRPKFQ